LETFESFDQELYPTNDTAFEEIALRLFHTQAVHNPVYRQYLAYIAVDPQDVTALNQVPCLPITLFKTHLIQTGSWDPEVTFSSSGTTGQQVSRHAVQSKAFYLRHSQRLFEASYGPLRNYHVYCLLPSYLERTGSSLVAMAEHFIKESASPRSGFFLRDLDRLARLLESQEADRQVLLLGVSFALLDLAEAYELDLSRCIVMETGGMKGRRSEITRAELHEILMKKFRVKTVHSEYGMTELMSQAYSHGQGIYTAPDAMRVFMRDRNDPFSHDLPESGVINVVDLANFRTCAFIETQDLGKRHQDGHFEVLGRIDVSDARGCNLLVE